MADDIEIRDSEEEEKVGDDDFHPTKTLAPAHDPIELEDDLLAGDPDGSTPVASIRLKDEDGDETEEIEDYFFNGYDNDTGADAEEDNFN